MHLTGKGVDPVAVDDVQAWDLLGLVWGLQQLAAVVDVAGVVPGPVLVGVLEADVGGAGWPVVVAAVAGCA